jgi:hypothetical protein
MRIEQHAVGKLSNGELVYSIIVKDKKTGLSVEAFKTEDGTKLTSNNTLNYNDIIFNEGELNER